MDYRDRLQQDAAQKLMEFKRLACLWATGTGKSNIVLKFLQVTGPIHTLIVVPETNNIQNWYAEFEKFNIPTFGVEVICYASLHKYQDTTWDLLVIDEAPHADTDLKSEYLSTITAQYVLALGAVITDEEMLTLRSVFGKFFVSRISLQQAIKWGLLPPPEVHILHMQLDNTQPQFVYQGRTLTEKAMYDVLHKEVKDAYAAYNAQAVEWRKNKMNQAGIKRKRFLGERKAVAMKRVCSALERKNIRFLCFCTSIEQAESLGGDKAFTSKTPKASMVLDKFNNHEINSLYVVGKLIEGQNLNDIHCGVIGQLGNSNRVTVQEIGRVLRSKKPVVYVPVFDDTKDDNFLFTITNNIPKEYIKHHNF